MTQVPKSAMLFAAGLGTRMGRLVEDRPKPMVTVAGRPLIDYTLQHVDDFGALTCVANLHYQPQKLADYLGPKNIQLSYEEPKILDTGGGLKAALPLLGPGPVFTLNTDAVWSGPNPLSVLADIWDPDRMDALLICIPWKNTRGRKTPGDFSIGDDGKLTRSGDFVYGGIQILKTEDIAACDRAVFSLNAIWNKISERGRLFGAKYSGKWCDVGHPEGVKLAEKLLLETDV